MSPFRPGLLLLLACGAPAPAALPPAALAPDDRLSDVIAAALAADARLETADSLYEPEAVVVADGQVRLEPPRYAGIGPGGEVAITTTRLEVRGTLAWAMVEYRWLSTAAGTAREGRVSLVLSPNARGAWRIRHAHSSSPPRV